MERILTFEARRAVMFGATDGDELDLRNLVLDDVGDKINEIVDWINKQNDK